MLKTEVTSAMVSGSINDGLGLQLYLVDGDLTLSEFEAAIETQGPLGPNDRVLSAEAMRPNWLLGGVHPASLSVQSEGIHLVGIDGGPIMMAKPRWTFATGKSWNFIAFNHGLAMTTGATLKIKAKSFGVWVT